MESKSEFGDFSNRYGYLQAGAAVEIALSRRFAIAPELRADIAATSVILRPALAAVIRF